MNLKKWYWCIVLAFLIIYTTYCTLWPTLPHGMRIVMLFPLIQWHTVKLLPLKAPIVDLTGMIRSKFHHSLLKNLINHSQEILLAFTLERPWSMYSSICWRGLSGSPNRSCREPYFILVFHYLPIIFIYSIEDAIITANVRDWSWAGGTLQSESSVLFNLGDHDFDKLWVF